MIMRILNVLANEKACATPVSELHTCVDAWVCGYAGVWVCWVCGCVHNNVHVCRYMQCDRCTEVCTILYALCVLSCVRVCVCVCVCVCVRTRIHCTACVCMC